MSQWKSVKIVDICDLITSGGTPLTSIKEYYIGGNIPWIKTKEVNQCRIYEASNYITKSGLENSSAKLIPENSIIIAMYGDGKTAGRVALNKVAVATNQACCNLILNKKIADHDFIFYNLMGRYDELVSKKTGSGQQNLNSKIIKEIDILLPSLNEQKSIASVLSSLDDKIYLLHRQNRTLKYMAETLFRQWFIEGEQDNWKITTLDYHITVAKGLSYKGAGLTTSNNGIPLFSLNSVLEGGGYKSTGLKYYNGDFKERHTIKPGDIIVANTEQGHEYRLIGYPAIIPKTESELSIYTHHLFKISFNDDSYLTNAFLYYLLCSKDMHEQVVAATNGSTVNQLSADGLQRPEFKLPPEYKVKEFTAQIASFWNKISINNSQIKNIESLRDTLLPRLMSGEVRVQYAEEAIASVA
ncbi:restriction endonuclease subunit S [Enterobacter ludwigii]|uniref:restriction endonuclease subunit S n=1 Tax=Enterobacter ludwigii TaxID=299767 RepID=UPI003BA3CE01